MCLFGNVRSKTTIRIAQVALLLFFLLQLPARHYPQFHPDLMDGVRGLCLGLAIGTMALSAWRNGRRSA